MKLFWTMDDRYSVQLIFCNNESPKSFNIFLLPFAAMSFWELVAYIFSQPGVTSFLSQRLCQDPIEKFFGCQRQRGGTNENPTVAEFYKNTQAVRVVNSFCRHNASGNCSGGMEKWDNLIRRTDPWKKKKISSSLEVNFQLNSCNIINM